MKVIKGLQNVRFTRATTAVTIGVFDGVHKGHRGIIKKTIDEALRSHLKSVVVTFDPHPSKVLYPGRAAPSLISLDHRIRLIESLGPDYLVILKFTKPLARLPAEKFVKGILLDKLGAGVVCASGNFFFGRGGAAGVRKLKALSLKYGFRVRVVNALRIGPRVASSSMIRRLVTAGDLKRAQKFLGRPVSVLGTVVSGSKFARILGYPTANINPHHEVIPPPGVYAVRALLGDKIYNGILNIGSRPTFFSSRDKEPTIEVHIFGFGGNIYGKDIEVEFIEKIRDERAFPSAEKLAEQIRHDALKAKAILGDKSLYKTRRVC